VSGVSSYSMRIIVEGTLPRGSWRSGLAVDWIFWWGFIMACVNNDQLTGCLVTEDVLLNSLQ
jgi:hypothetical protein